MLLIFCAFRRELAVLNGRLQARRRLPRELAGTIGTLNGEEVALVASGIGPPRAKSSARRALDLLPPPRLILTSGVAGALRPDLEPRDLILADSLILEAPDPCDGPQTIHLNPDLIGKAELLLHDRAIRFSRGPLFTTNRVLGSAADKATAQKRTGAIAVDMESGAIAAALSPAELSRLLCLRAVLDRAGEELIGAGMTGEDGSVAPLKAAAFFVTHPGALTRVPALLRNLSHATAALARGLEALCTGPDPRADPAPSPTRRPKPAG